MALPASHRNPTQEHFLQHGRAGGHRPQTHLDVVQQTKRRQQVVHPSAREPPPRRPLPHLHEAIQTLEPIAETLKGLEVRRQLLLRLSGGPCKGTPALPLRGEEQMSERRGPRQQQTIPGNKSVSVRVPAGDSQSSSALRMRKQPAIRRALQDRPSNYNTRPATRNWLLVERPLYGPREGTRVGSESRGRNSVLASVLGSGTHATRLQDLVGLLCLGHSVESRDPQTGQEYHTPSPKGSLVVEKRHQRNIGGEKGWESKIVQSVFVSSSDWVTAIVV